MSMHAVPALAIEGIAKSFGGLRVLSDVSVTLGQGECLGLIGPNGAGKTTLFNIVTGFLTPDYGRIAFDGRDITMAKPDVRVRAGLVRTFQKSMAFPELSVRENLALAARSGAGESYGWLGARKAVEAADAAADALLTRAGLRERAELLVAGLSYGEQRIVDVLISLAMRPRVLLLDEPTAGLSRGEGEHLIEVVRTLGEGLSSILIAHDLDIVFGLCDRVAVLDLGRLIACDTPDAIKANEGAQAAYLGATFGEAA
ncbi:ABC transporter ATP-binding protein [Bosea thiooxidans]|nr:ABC transporter ATP-binding protein [Bosea sp. (in: a-proteobacteria)]